MFYMESRKLVMVVAAGAALSVVMGSAAEASVLTLANVLAAKGNQIPGQAPGVTWGALNTPSVALDGRVAFSGSLVGVPAVNNLGIFSGTNAANTNLYIQSGTQAPGGPVGATMDLNGASNGLQTASAKINADGVISYVSLMTGGGTVANVNNWGVFSGTVSGGFGMFARRGGVIPGTGGATHSTAFSTSVAGIPINGSGVGYFGGGLAGGDVVGTTNNDALFGGTAGSINIIARRGGAAPGVAGGTFGSLTNPVPIMSNSGGQVLFGNTLNATGGVTTANDATLYRYTPGVGSELVAREGDAAPGTAGATYSTSFNLFTHNFNNAGQAAFSTTLVGGDVVGTTNNSAIYVATPAGASLAWRKGSAAPGTDGNFVSANAFDLSFDNAGRIASTFTIGGGTVTTANDSGLWYGAPGALNLIAREGGVVPTLNATFNFISNIRSNDIGQLVFTSSMLSVDTNLNAKTVLMAYDPTLGMFPLIYTGEQIEVSPGVFKTVSSFTLAGASNSDGGNLALSDSGWLTVKISTADTTDVIVQYAIPAPGAISLLGVAGLVMARRRR